LPAGFAVLAGKIDFAAWADTSFFANNERNQFLHEGLTNNPILGSFVPYTTLGSGLVKQFGDEVAVAVVVTSNDTDALSAGFDDYDFDAMTYGLAATWTPEIGGLPGLYNALAGYSSKSVVAFDIDERYLLDEISGVSPIIEEDDNYALTLGGTQYVRVDRNAQRSDGQAVGFGPFFRFGIAPEDRNLIDQFYSVGIGGNGGPAGRADDGWGIGWAGTHISADLRRDAAVLGADIDKFEHVFEAFYNVALTPAVRLSFHVQHLDSANASADEATVLATRLQTDF